MLKKQNFRHSVNGLDNKLSIHFGVDKAKKNSFKWKAYQNKAYHMEITF